VDSGYILPLGDRFIKASMAEDHYATLGVERTASADDIRKAYRQLARKYHPDLNPNDAKAKEKFQEVQNAFDVLNDVKKREMYDRYGSAYESVGSGARGPNPWAGGSGGPQVDIDMEDLFGGGGGGFADLFRQFGQRGKRQQTRREVPTRGANIEHELTVPFTTAVLGGEAQIGIQRADGHVDTLQVKIPAGIEDGKKIRLRGQGEPSLDGGPEGDLLIKVLAAPHPYFRRHGKQLEVRVPVTLAEALNGAKIDVPTPHGTISLTVPSGASSGKKLRIKGQGVKPANGLPGDLLAEIQIELPEKLSNDDREAISKRLDKYTDNPRADLRW
jgi:curved DNA-binding protein